MKINKRIAINQKGFAHILIFVVVIVVGIISFTAYRVFSSDDTDSSVVTTESQEKISQNADEQSSLDVDANSEINSQAENQDTTNPNTSNDSTTHSSDTVTSSGGSSGSSEPVTTSGGSGGGSGSGSSGGGASQPAAKTFTIDSFSFGYSTSTINVSPGDVVTINLTNSGGKHDWVVDEISGAATAIINGGQTDSITFTVPQSAAGKTYKFYCSVGNHRALGMEGNLVISSY